MLFEPLHYVAAALDFKSGIKPFPHESLAQIGFGWADTTIVAGGCEYLVMEKIEHVD